MQISSKSPKDPPVEALDLGELIQEPHHADDLVGGTVAPLHFEPVFPLRPCRKLSICLCVPLAQFGTLVLLFVKGFFCKDYPSLQLPILISWNQCKIASSVTTFSPGTHYHFVVTNHGNTAHEFMILPKSEGNMEMGMGNTHKIAFASIDMIHPGETKTLDYTFLSSAASSHPEFACYLPGHYDAGMKQRVSVTS